ncbi:hypothetical protein RBWH47_00688 [Rhodopirellula baltica WH47]|uniref:Uncharacterized protein n=1 Tax=Rhodopirellula baltica WH47 TaxID=991778 RepID=F2ALE9_RHOBT|nr:hypothetical protein RBWH47_00688 [Rhodopirellula baltica WH47]
MDPACRFFYAPTEPKHSFRLRSYFSRVRQIGWNSLAPDGFGGDSMAIVRERGAENDPSIAFDAAKISVGLACPSR